MASLEKRSYSSAQQTKLTLMEHVLLLVFSVKSRDLAFYAGILSIGVSRRMSYPVEDGGPALHRDALEHGQHGKADVVEGGDAVVGSLPLLEADGDVGVAGIGAHGGLNGVVRMAWYLH